MLMVWCPKYIYIYIYIYILPIAQIIGVGRRWGVNNLGKVFTIGSKKTFPSYLPLCNGTNLWCNLHHGKQEVVKVELESRVILNIVPEEQVPHFYADLFFEK
jgi:hypothetical protein